MSQSAQATITKYPRLGNSRNNVLTVLEAGNPKIKIPTNLGENPLPGFREPLSCCALTRQREEEKALVSLLPYKDGDPITTQTPHLQIPAHCDLGL